MIYLVHLPSGQSVRVTGQFKGVSKLDEKLIAPAIELDERDENGNRKWFLFDPRAVCMEQHEERCYQVVYNPLLYMKYMADDMRQAMKKDPTWPQRVLGSMS